MRQIPPQTLTPAPPTPAPPMVRGTLELPPGHTFTPLPGRRCKWSKYGGHQYWETSCGKAFALNVGTPNGVGMKFCCYCGGKLSQHTHAKLTR